VVDVPEGGDRGISELIGMVLLIGIVLVGAVTVVVLGAGAISDAGDQTRVESAQTHLQHLDGRLATLAVGDDQTRVTFEAGRSLARDYRIDRSGSINVTVDRNGSCAVQQSFSTVLFEDSQGQTVGYEAGGVWSAGIDGSTATSPPQLTFEGGTLSVRLLNLTGQIDQRTNEAILNVTESGKTGASSRMYGINGAQPATTNARNVTNAVRPGDFPAASPFISSRCRPVFERW